MLHGPSLALLLVMGSQTAQLVRAPTHTLAQVLSGMRMPQLGSCCDELGALQVALESRFCPIARLPGA